MLHLLHRLYGVDAPEGRGRIDGQTDQVQHLMRLPVEGRVISWHFDTNIGRTHLMDIGFSSLTLVYLMSTIIGFEC